MAKKRCQIQRECQYCHSIFMIWPSRLVARWCSKRCQHLDRTIKAKCLGCGKEFISPKSLLAKNCSWKCRETKVYKIKCLVCNKKVKVTPNKIGIKKYCSWECRLKGMKGQQNGERNPVWKGGVTPQTKILRRMFCKTISQEILKRDNFTCQICFKKGGYLHVDHIQTWSDYAELRFKKENLRTVCRECHYKITYGKNMPENSKWGVNNKINYFSFGESLQMGVKS